MVTVMQSSKTRKIRVMRCKLGGVSKNQVTQPHFEGLAAGFISNILAKCFSMNKPIWSMLRCLPMSAMVKSIAS